MSLKRILFFAPTLFQQTVRLKRPIAHGQAIIMTVIAMRKEDSAPIVGFQIRM